MASVKFIEKHLFNHNMGMHSHDYLEIIYIMEGEGCFEFEKFDAINYKKDDILVIPVGVAHKNCPSKNMKKTNLMLDNWNNNFVEPVIARCSEESDIPVILELIYKYYHAVNRDEEIVINLTNALLKLIKYNVRIPDVSESSKKIEEAIINGFTDPFFDLQEVYKSIPYNGEKLRKAFLADYGITPHSYLVQKRIDAAMDLLKQNRDHNYTFREISELCGFSDPLYFSRVFKKKTGASPKAFYKAYGKEEKS